MQEQEKKMSKGKLVLEKVKDFQLDHVFECGQCFRWNREDDGSYTGIAGGKVINLSKKGDNITIDNITTDEFMDFWREYFDFDTDYSEIKQTLIEKDPVMEKAIAAGEGIRILNQELWETVISFIISANNNIPRIKGSVEALCERFGEKICTYRGKDRYAFPAPEVLAKLTQDELVPCGVGYRAKYIIATAKDFVTNGTEFYESLRDSSVSWDRAMEKISKLSGVGPKVANCILLFSLGKREAFPIDVWMKKVMSHLYGFDENDVKGMAEFAKETYGNDAGIAQQYLFYYMRNVNLSEDDE